MKRVTISASQDYGNWVVEGLQYYEPRGDWDEGGIEIDKELDPAVTYYAVCACYHDGNTFHHDEEAHYELCDVFTDLRLAQECAKQLVRTDKLMHKNKFDYRWKDSVHWTRDMGPSPANFHVPWTLVFTTLSRIDIVPTTLKTIGRQSKMSYSPYDDVD
jgi:hypothetical protein